jgi:nucleoside-triphosphatase THEP1
MTLKEALSSHARVAIVGAPGTGKSTLASQRDDAVCTSDWACMGWRTSGVAALRHQLQLGRERYVVEGVAAAHAVRAMPDAFDAVIVMQTPKHDRYKQHIAVGNQTILDPIPGLKIYYELACMDDDGA